MFLATTAKITALVLTGVATLTLAFGAFGAPQSVLVPAEPQEEQESGYLGVTITSPGLTIGSVVDGHAAAQAGLQAGDRIVWFADRDVETFDQLVELLAQHPPGTKVGIVVQRGEETHKARLVLGSKERILVHPVEEVPPPPPLDSRDRIEREIREALQAPPIAPPGQGFLGVYLEPDDGAAVVGGTVPDSAAARAKLQPGDRIVSIGDHRVTSSDQLRKLLASHAAGDRVAIGVERGDQHLIIEVALGARAGAPPLPVPRGDDHRAEIERLFRQLQERGTDQSPRRLENRRPLKFDTRQQLRVHRRTMEAVLDEIVNGDRLDFVDPATRSQIARELREWAAEQAEKLRHRDPERGHLERIEHFLDGARQEHLPGALEKLRETKRRVAEAERDLREMFEDEVAPQGEKAMGAMKEALGDMREEMEVLRRELDTLRRALRERTGDR